MKEKQSPSFLEAIIICHGQSEYIIFQKIKQEFKLNIEVYFKNSPVQITSFHNVLYNTIFKNCGCFKEKYPSAFDENGNLYDSFKIFIVADNDDCTYKEFINYRDKKSNIFKKHWLKDRIITIYNTKNLECVLTKAKFPFKSKTNKAKKKEYKGILKKYTSSRKLEEFLIDINKKLFKNANTNMDILLKFLLDLHNKNRK